MGFMCWVRKWKAQNRIPCGKYPTIAMLRIGTFTENIADRPLPQEFVEWRLLSKDELTAEGRKQQHPISDFAVADSQTESQP
eukprot:3686629-Prymnesium_polylepis.1